MCPRSMCLTRQPKIFSRAVAWALALVLAALCAPAAAQSGSGVAAIEGSVTDEDNGAIAGALVFIMSTQTGYERAVYTDARGRYFASAMPVSTYVIDASAAGFARVQREGVRLVVGATETINFAMKIAAISETITVSAARPLLEEDASDSSTVVGARAVSELPIRSRA